MKCMQTNGYGLFNSPMLYKSIAVTLPILIQNNTAKNMKRIILILSFTSGETKIQTNKQTIKPKRKERDM